MVRVGLDARAARDFSKDFDFLQPEISIFFSPTGVTGKYLDLLGFQLSNTWQVSWILDPAESALKFFGTSVPYCRLEIG